MTPLHQTARLMVSTSSPQLWQQHEEAGDLLQHTVPFFRRLVLTLMVNIICGVVHGVYVNLSQCFMEPGHKKCVYCVNSERAMWIKRPIYPGAGEAEVLENQLEVCHRSVATNNRFEANRIIE